METQHFTQATQELIKQSIALAQHYKHETVLPLHSLAVGLHKDFCLSFFHMLDVDVQQLSVLLEKELADIPVILGKSTTIDPNFHEFLEQCKHEAQKLHDRYVSLEHILIQWSKTKYLPEKIRTFFSHSNFTPKNLLQNIDSLRAGKKAENGNAENQYQVLDKYCHDLTTLARNGKLDPVIGRHEEIRRVIQILSRRTKNNPVLIGEPGVGKTAIVEGIAQRIIENDVPQNLQNKKICSLDLGLLIAGAKYQGEFENRLKSILKEIEESQGNIIVFIDELHMLIGAGSSGGGMDASNLLKPALARGTLHCIGATTLAEYKKYIEKDAALERRFQKVLVEEPSIEDTISILRGLKERYELHHGIRIKDQALVEAVELSAQNIPERFLPDKAIDIIDEAASMVKMSIDSQPEAIDKLNRTIRQLEIEKVALEKEKDEKSQKRLQELEKELAQIKEEHATLVSQWRSEKAPLEKINQIKEQIEQATIEFSHAEREGNYAKASEIKYGTIETLKKDLDKQQEKLKGMPTTLIKQDVDVDDVAHVVARWTGIPVEKLEASEQEKILNMQTYLNKKVIGQNEALQSVTQAIQLHRAGLADAKKPIGSFLFLGPTGVGKTEVARTLADFLFNDPLRMVRIDMSEYMEQHSVARLIGAPPGYIGYEEGGQLTEQVRRHPYSVILFDEIEKAHPDIFNIFLQILDDGRLTDNQGRTISFKNCIIIMTSNLGSDLLLESKEVTPEVKEKINILLRKKFRPEFLNRIDEIVFFRVLSEENIQEIAHLQIAELADRLKAKEVQLEIAPLVYKEIAKRGYSTEFGARPLKRAIHTFIAIPIARHLLEHPDTKNIKIIIKNGKLTVQ